MLNLCMHLKMVDMTAQAVQRQMSLKSATEAPKWVGETVGPKVESGRASGNPKWPTHNLAKKNFWGWW